MKRFILILLTLCLPLCAALAQDVPDSPFFHISGFAAEDVDVSGVQAIGGRLVGVVKLPNETVYGLPTAALYVDCPLPEDFSEEQKATLYVTHASFTEEEAIAAANVPYSKAEEIDSAYYHAQLSSAGASHDPAYAAQYAQAKSIARSLVVALGGDVAEDVYHANRRDAAHNDPYSLAESSDAREMSAKRRAHFERAEAKYGRTSCDVTMVRGLYALRGLPVMDQYYQKADDGWLGESSEFRAAVRDDGTLCFAAVEGLPVVTDAAPLVLPDFDWQILLRNAVAKLFASNAIPEDAANADGSVRYAGYAVITKLAPCWVGATADTLVPGWFLVTQDRMASDGSVAATWALYGDAQTLMTK